MATEDSAKSHEETPDTAGLPPTTRAALGVVGAWSDLDWDEMIDALDEIGHQNQPTPPIDEP